MDIALGAPVPVQGRFLIVNRSFDGDNNRVDLRCQEDPDAAYEWDQATIDGIAARVADYDPPPQRGSLDILPPTAVRLAAEAESHIAPDGSFGVEVTAEIEGGDGDDNALVAEVEIRQGDDGTWRSRSAGGASISRPTGRELRVGIMASGARVFARARFRHPAGLLSGWVESTAFIVPRDETPPEAPASLDVVHRNSTAMRIRLAPVAARDLSHFELRYTFAPLGVNAPAITDEAGWRPRPSWKILFAPPARSNEHGGWRVSTWPSPALTASMCGRWTVPATGR